MHVKKIATDLRLDDAVGRQSEIKSVLLDIEVIEAAAQKEIERIVAAKNAKLRVLERRIQKAAQQLSRFFDAERKNLPATDSGTAVKTIVGKYVWYPGKASIDDSGAVEAIAYLEKRKIEDALTRVVTLDKNYLLKHPELVRKVPGIAIAYKKKRAMYFVGTPLRVEREHGKRRWQVVRPKKK